MKRLIPDSNHSEPTGFPTISGVKRRKREKKIEKKRKWERFPKIELRLSCDLHKIMQMIRFQFCTYERSEICEVRCCVEFSEIIPTFRGLIWTFISTARSPSTSIQNCQNLLKRSIQAPLLSLKIIGRRMPFWEHPQIHFHPFRASKSKKSISGSLLLLRTSDTSI